MHNFDPPGKPMSYSGRIKLGLPNLAFGMHLEASRYDRINLRDVEHGHEVMALSKLPNPFCRHCDVEHNHKIGWRPSRKDRSEWFLN